MANQFKLTDPDFCRAAQTLKCSPEAIKAVSLVESSGSGFYDDGFPTILFERHIFWKNAPRSIRQQWYEAHPEICNPKATPKGGYGGKDTQRVKFTLAMSLDPDTAMKACSWGMFQELGENYKDCGFDSVGAFVDMMKSGAAGHLEIFVRSIQHRHLADELQREDWDGFAVNYNGSSYRKWKYDDKMAAARARVHKIDCTQTAPAILPPVTIHELPPMKIPAGIPAFAPGPIQGAALPDPPKPVEPEQSPTGETAKVESMQPYEGVGFFPKIKTDLAVITGGNTPFQILDSYGDKIQQSVSWIPAGLFTKLAWLVIAASVGYLLFRVIHYLIWIHKEKERIKIEAANNADPAKKDIEWTATKV